MGRPVLIGLLVLGLCFGSFPSAVIPVDVVVEGTDSRTSVYTQASSDYDRESLSHSSGESSHSAVPLSYATGKFSHTNTYDTREPGFEPTSSHRSADFRSASSGIDRETPCPRGPPGTQAMATAPRIEAIYPNPPAAGNEGEHLVVSVPRETNLTGWTITDGHTTATIPNVTVEDTVALTVFPERAGTFTHHDVLAVDGHLRLAVDGDHLTLSNASGYVVDEVYYERAPASHVWHRLDEVDAPGQDWRAMDDSRDSDRIDDAVGAPSEHFEEAGRLDGDGVWWPAGGTCEYPLAVEPDSVTTFVLPDSGEPILEALDAADERILLSGYTFTDEAIAAALHDAVERGVTVRLLLEAGPVGGTPEATRPIVDDLVAVGATVRVMGGPDSRYVFHHPKYAVADDRSVVLTENWKPAGTGGASSRGWGVVVTDAEIADALAVTFEADSNGTDVNTWRDHRESTAFVEEDAPGATFDTHIAPETAAVDHVELLLAPDNAAVRLQALLATAESSISIKQVRIGDPGFPLLDAVLDAARRGVEIRILLDDSWYVADENRELAAALERTADAEDLDLEVRLADTGDRFEKVHAKGIVIDGEIAVVGSVNWNNNSLYHNREVLLALFGEESAAYYTRVFEDDWAGGHGGAWRLPIVLVIVLSIGLTAAAEVGRRTISILDPEAVAAYDPRELHERRNRDSIELGERVEVNPVDQSTTDRNGLASDDSDSAHDDRTGTQPRQSRTP